MKKIKLLLLKIVLCISVLSSALLCNGCFGAAAACIALSGAHAYYEGIDNFDKDKGESSVGLTRYLIPDGFLEDFEYIDGKYYYKFDEESIFSPTNESTLMYLIYDDSVYDDAKNYVLNDFEVNEEIDTPIGACGIYNFYTNKKSIYEVSSRHFNAFTFDDASKTLIFVGYYSDYKQYRFKDNQIVNFDDLLKKYFPWYDFES